MTEKSAAEKTHEIVAKWPDGYEFSSSYLKTLYEMEHGPTTNGQISGFLNRAQKKYMVKAKGKAGRAIRYVLLDRTVTWEFHKPGIGSLPGRDRKPPHYQDLPDLDQPEPGLHLDPAIYGNQSQEDVIISHNDDGVSVDFGPVIDEIINTSSERRVSIIEGGLSDQLLEIAAKVADLEDRPATTLNDFTISEILDHLKERLK